jgi:hypothetical protein
MTENSPQPEEQKLTGTPAAQPTKDPNELRIAAAPGVDGEKQLTRGVLSPHLAAAMVSKVHWETMTARDLNYNHLIEVLKENTEKISKGDLSDAEAMLYSQASSLNLMFAHLNTLAVNNLIAKGKFEFGRQLMGMALKAQNQSRMTLETLALVKNPPVFARQANINNGGHQQVNNGSASRAPATENENLPNKLLEQSNEQRMDIGTESPTGRSDTEMATVGKLDRPSNG